MHRLACVIVLPIFASISVTAFAPRISSIHLTPPTSLSADRKAVINSPTALNSSGDPFSFNVSRPTFDLFTLRNVRGDALMQYNSLNQSEPLRINLYALLTFSLLSFPAIAEAVLGEGLSLPGNVGSILGSVGCFALFLRECGRRSRQLTRIQKELNAEFLAVRMPNNLFAERRYGKEVQLKDLRGNKRVVAICGTKEQLKEALVQARVFRRRLYQSAAIVVPIPIDGSSARDWGLRDEEVASSQFAAEPQDVAEWINYFDDLRSEGDEEKLIWFGLNNNGRSFASGAGDPPRILEVMGQNLRPVEVLLESDPSEKSGAGNSEAVNAVLAAQEKFYGALTAGDLLSMQAVLSKNECTEVSEVVAGGGRIDDWVQCLKEGARPSDMIASGSDVLILSPDEAFSTTVEFPSNAGIDGATLLACQKWKIEDGDWKLQLHQTIPWSPDSRAGGTLLCDSRGCVALTRGRERTGGIVPLFM